MRYQSRIGGDRQTGGIGSGSPTLRGLRVCVWGLVLTALHASVLSAAVFRVDAITGSDGPSCGSEASPCATIQQAVDLSSSGDTILVSEGIYTDSVSCPGSPAVVCVFQTELTILGGFSAGNWSLPDPANNTTVIDGQNVRRGIIAKRGGSDPGLPATSLRMEGFTVRRGRAEGAPHGLGGGLQANFTDVVLRDMVFENNVAVGGGGGIGGGGGAAIQANENRSTSAVLERIVFRNNQAVGGGGTGGVGQGGGLIVDHAALTALRLDFQNNSATGGASATSGKDGLGGAAAFTFGTVATVQSLTATGNTATGGTASDTSGSAFGGAFFLEGAESPAANVTTVEILDAAFSGNTARAGDAAVARGGVGGAISVFGAQLTLDRSSLIGNLGAGGTGDAGRGNAGGGGLFLEWPFSSTAPLNVVRNSIIADNNIDGSQGGGAGLRLLGARALVVHSTFVDNRILLSGLGNGILVGPRLTKPSELTLAYSILADHTLRSSARALHVQLTPSAGSSADLTDLNLFVGNAHDTNAGASNSGTYIGFPGSNIFDPSPSTFFVDPATSNYHIDGTNPPTDAAAGSGETVDVDGATRSGTRDLGADEVGAVAFGLTVAKVGVGTGTVTSSPPGINCGADCFESYDDATSVSLNPTPDTGFFFTGWTGDADCSDGNVLMNQDLQCTAKFEDQAPVVCSVAQVDLVLTNENVNTTVVESACHSITAGPSYAVGASGDVTFEAPSIVLRSGFVVRGSFAAVNGTP